MANAKKIKEIHVATENKVGMLREISSLISGGGANITAIAAYGMEDKARFMIATDNNQKAVAALSGKGYKPEEKSVIEAQLENRPGALEKMGAKLAQANIDINYIYGTVGASGAPARIIFSTNNDEKALGLLK